MSWDQIWLAACCVYLHVSSVPEEMFLVLWFHLCGPSQDFIGGTKMNLLFVVFLQCLQTFSQSNEPIWQKFFSLGKHKEFE